MKQRTTYRPISCHTSTLTAAALTAGLLGLGCQAPELDDVGPDEVAVEMQANAVVVATLQAEAARLSGAIVASNQAGYTGSGFADYQHASGDFVEWTVTAPAAGDHLLTFRYANGSTSSRPLAIAVNGAVVQAGLAFPGTGSWTSWKTVALSAKLIAGVNAIRATATGTSGANIDNLVVSTAAAAPAPTPTPTPTPTPPPPTATPGAADLLALTEACVQVSSGKYATDEGGAATVPVCKLNGAVFWKADMDIDCDGKQTSTCNSNTDPWYQSQTSFGGALDAAVLPYVVIPLPSSKFDYTKQGISGGQSVAVIYGNKVVYGVFGDEGPSGIIGEASVAMATALGIPSNPKSGGVDAGVTYIVFTGATGVVAPLTSTTAAADVGKARAAELLRTN
jgi:hypothetical protein